MRFPFATGVLLFLATLSACGRTPLADPGAAVFELPFEGSWDPNTAASLEREASPSGISFDSGVEGRAARFDGSGAELKFRGIGALHLENAMTLEFFVKPDDWINPYGAGSGLGSVVSHSDIFTVAFTPKSWKLQARLTTSAQEEPLRLEGGTVPPGAWHHVALVFDGPKGQARLVLNGEVVSEVSAAGTVPIRNNLPLGIGTWFQRNQAFCGALDSIRLSNRALSPDELRARAALVQTGARP